MALRDPAICELANLHVLQTAPERRNAVLIHMAALPVEDYGARSAAEGRDKAWRLMRALFRNRQ